MRQLTRAAKMSAGLTNLGPRHPTGAPRVQHQPHPAGGIAALFDAHFDEVVTAGERAHLPGRAPFQARHPTVQPSERGPEPIPTGGRQPVHPADVDGLIVGVEPDRDARLDRRQAVSAYAGQNMVLLGQAVFRLPTRSRHRFRSRQCSSWSWKFRAWAADMGRPTARGRVPPAQLAEYRATGYVDSRRYPPPALGRDERVGFASECRRRSC
jgi:hypothetical protein